MSGPGGVVLERNGKVWIDGTDIIVNADKDHAFRGNMTASYKEHLLVMGEGGSLHVRCPLDKECIAPTFDITVTDIYNFNHILWIPKEGTFDIYYNKEAQTTRYTALDPDNKKPVKGNLLIKEESLKPYVKVFFKDGLKDEVITIQRVELNDDAIEPVSPDHEGYVKKGWDAPLTSIAKVQTITMQYEKAAGFEMVSGDCNLLERDDVRFYNKLGADMTAQKNNLPAGTYILRSGNQVQKISVR